MKMINLHITYQTKSKPFYFTALSLMPVIMVTITIGVGRIELPPIYL